MMADSGCKGGADPFQGSEQDVDFLHGVVAGKGGANGGGHAVVFHDRHGTVVAGAQGHSLEVHEGADIVGVDAVQHKGEGTGAVSGPANAPQTGEVVRQDRKSTRLNSSHVAISY